MPTFSGDLDRLAVAHGGPELPRLHGGERRVEEADVRRRDRLDVLDLSLAVHAADRGGRCPACRPWRDLRGTRASARAGACAPAVWPRARRRRRNESDESSADAATRPRRRGRAGCHHRCAPSRRGPNRAARAPGARGTTSGRAVPPRPAKNPIASPSSRRPRRIPRACSTSRRAGASRGAAGTGRASRCRTRPRAGPERLDELVEGLAEADHDAGLGLHRRARPAAPRVGARDELERLGVARLGADAAVETRNRLRVVVQDLGRFGEDRFERVRGSAEVGDQDLDGAARERAGGSRGSSPRSAPRRRRAGRRGSRR